MASIAPAPNNNNDKRNNNNKTFNHPSGKSHAELLEHVHYQVSLKKTKRCVQSVTGIFGFLFLGALIFYELEHEAERIRAAEWAETEKSINAYLDEIENATKFGLISSKHFTTLKNYINGDISSETSLDAPNWDYPGCMFFTFTLISTIGYGTFSAQTDGGKVASALFSIIGVAYFGFVLSHVSERIIHFVNYVNKITVERRKKKEEKEEGEEEAVRSNGDEENAELEEGEEEEEEKAPLPMLIVMTSIFLTLFTLITIPQLGLPIGDSIYFAIITFTTVGLGDFAPDPRGTLAQRVVSYSIFGFLCLFGLSLLSALIAAVGDVVISMRKKMENLHFEKMHTVHIGLFTIHTDHKEQDMEDNTKELCDELLQTVRAENGAESDTYKATLKFTFGIQKENADKSNLKVVAEQISNECPKGKMLVEVLMQ